MLGAMIGDIAGSVYEFDNCRSKDFPMLSERCCFTDDTVMTAAVANVCRMLYTPGETIREDVWRSALTREMRRMGRAYTERGYGGRFLQWLYEDDPKPYYSWGNGSAMRASPVSFIAGSLEECRTLARLTAEPTHDHPEGIAGAECTACAGYLALHGAGKAGIRRFVEENYYSLDFTIDGIRETYAFNETCRDTVPQAIEAFLESTDFEDAIRLAVSVGGDSDTLAAITGGIAEAFYGIPEELETKALRFLSPELRTVVSGFRDFVKALPETCVGPFADVHAHILPGVDDGAQNTSESIMVLRAMYNQGIRAVFATSHCAGWCTTGAAERQLRLRLLRKAAAEMVPGIRILSGTETLCEHGKELARLDTWQALPLNGTKYVLAEFDPTDPEHTADYVRESLRALRDAGWIPVIAHAERYPVLYEKEGTVESLVSEGALIQINAYSIDGEKKASTRRAAEYLLEHRLVSFIGSDSHRFDHRPPNEAGFRRITEICDPEYAEEITWKNADVLLMNDRQAE